MIRHVDALEPRRAPQPRRDPPGGPRRRVRRRCGSRSRSAAQKHGKGLPQLLQLFPSSVELPPLRLHLEDLPLLVSVFLSRLSQGGHLVCSPEAMRLLMRMSWPGNAEQLHQLLREVVQHRRTGMIAPEDLPPEVHAVSRRVLTPLEAMERDAIVKCLADANGNKVQAARSLGMSRATIYRKIHDYGIVPPTA